MPVFPCHLDADVLLPEFFHRLDGVVHVDPQHLVKLVILDYRLLDHTRNMQIYLDAGRLCGADLGREQAVQPGIRNLLQRDDIIFFELFALRDQIIDIISQSSPVPQLYKTGKAVQYIQVIVLEPSELIGELADGCLLYTSRCV